MFALVLTAVAGCGDSGGPTCTVDADCASMSCLPDGTCAPPPEVDSGPPPGDASASDASPSDGGTTGDAGTPRDGGPLPGCVPNHDGRVERLEVPLRAGLRATFRGATDVDVDTAGEDIGGGRRRWDLAAALPGDHAVLVETLDPAGYWFADRYPSAAYVARLTESSDLLGIFELSASELALAGVASPEESFSATRMSHDPPVTTLRFPLERGASWSTDASVTGQNLGVPAAWLEDYAQEVDAEGELSTPFGTFEVLRVKVTLVRTVGIVPTTVRSFLFVSECFGTVASITSRDGETREEFTRAAEVRRLAP